MVLPTSGDDAIDTRDRGACCSMENFPKIRCTLLSTHERAGGRRTPMLHTIPDLRPSSDTFSSCLLVRCAVQKIRRLGSSALALAVGFLNAYRLHAGFCPNFRAWLKKSAAHSTCNERTKLDLQSKLTHVQQGPKATAWALVLLSASVIVLLCCFALIGTCSMSQSRRQEWQWSHLQTSGVASALSDQSHSCLRKAIC